MNLKLTEGVRKECGMKDCSFLGHDMQRVETPIVVLIFVPLCALHSAQQGGVTQNSLSH
jgi:hypothetical protein